MKIAWLFPLFVALSSVVSPAIAEAQEITGLDMGSSRITVTLPYGKTKVFEDVLLAIMDSGFEPKQANVDAGIITTLPRVRPAGLYRHTIRALMLSAGPRSTRVILSVTEETDLSNQWRATSYPSRPIVNGEDGITHFMWTRIRTIAESLAKQ